MKATSPIALVSALITILSNTGMANGISDTFDDGAIDSALWQWGGSKRGVGGYGSGSWSWSHEEVTATDGYLSMRVWGPTSGNTFGSDSWVRTKYNYNDGLNHVINFKWGAAVNASHIDGFAVQVTNGADDGDTDIHLDWFYADSAGRRNLYLTSAGWSLNTPYYHPEGLQNTPPTDWSIYIDAANKTGTLYDGANLTGSVIGQNTFTATEDWYLRFIQVDATSAGYPAGDNSVFLYNYASESSASSVPDSSDLIFIAPFALCLIHLASRRAHSMQACG